MYQNQSFKLVGVSQLMMHNVRLANPLDPIAKAMKKVSSKRKKTEDDFAELSRIEFEGGLYLDADGNYIIPARAIEAAIIKGATKTKQGTLAKSAMLIYDDAFLKYAGPKSVKKRFADKSCVDMRAVRVGQATVMRTRPVFSDWSAEVSVHYDPAQASLEDVGQWLVTAGRIVGLLEYRPRFGRFEVEPC